MEPKMTVEEAVRKAHERVKCFRLSEKLARVVHMGPDHKATHMTRYMTVSEANRAHHNELVRVALVLMGMDEEHAECHAYAETYGPVEERVRTAIYTS